MSKLFNATTAQNIDSAENTAQPQPPSPSTHDSHRVDLLRTRNPLVDSACLAPSTRIVILSDADNPPTYFNRYDISRRLFQTTLRLGLRAHGPLGDAVRGKESLLMYDVAYTRIARFTSVSVSLDA
ncbi:hypothetical protein FB45DRAFT_1038496 [Roridomyces roridus]|uniref:Uncharacterized protein n=1 Tax=Roridomyces roridus TaxID=1738132 RepID=A0AAD7B4E7_9AGAR|nr:hypothetical protein FB45DRAFT_1038496 [Roridomyces roridus]